MKFYKLIAISEKEYDEDSGDKQADNKIYSQSCVFKNNKCYIYVDEKEQSDLELDIDYLSDRLKVNRKDRNLEAENKLLKKSIVLECKEHQEFCAKANWMIREAIDKALTSVEFDLVNFFDMSQSDYDYFNSVFKRAREEAFKKWQS